MTNNPTTCRMWYPKGLAVEGEPRTKELREDKG